jgi:hypothetical protein
MPCTAAGPDSRCVVGNRLWEQIRYWGDDGNFAGQLEEMRARRDQEVTEYMRFYVEHVAACTRRR